MFRLAFLFSLGGALALALCSHPIHAQEPEKKVSPWDELSKEDQQKLREALRSVWSDPIVLSARENVNRSAREYHKAIRESMAKQDPESAALLEKLGKSENGMLHSLMGGGKKKPPQSGRYSQMLAPPPMMEKMNEEQKLRFKKAGATARQKSEVVAALEQLKSLSKEDEAIRMKKMEAFRNFRRAYFDAVVEAEPDLEPLVPPPGSSPMSHHGKGGKGRGGKGLRIPELQPEE